MIENAYKRLSKNCTYSGPENKRTLSQVMTDVAIPKDLPKTPRMLTNNYGFEPASDNPKKLTIRFTPDPIVQAVAKKSMTHNQSRPNSTVGLLK